MQKADIVLSILRKKSKNDEQYKYDRIYRNFFNRDLYLRAYSKIYAKEGNMTAGTDGKTIDGFSKKNIESLIILYEELIGKRKTGKCARWVFPPLRTSSFRRL